MGTIDTMEFGNLNLDVFGLVLAWLVCNRAKNVRFVH